MKGAAASGRIQLLARTFSLMPTVVASAAKGISRGLDQTRDMALQSPPVPARLGVDSVSGPVESARIADDPPRDPPVPAPGRR